MATKLKNRKLYHVHLTDDEREQLTTLVRSGRVAGWKIQRAQALLKCDESPGAPAWTDEQIAEAFDAGVRTVEGWRKKAVEDGPLSLLERKPQDRAMQRKLDGVGEAQLVTIACSDPPEGHDRWSLRLLAGRLVELKVVDSISREAVRCALQKTV
ncbi:helix-turn-helix domain-containing protein [Phycisphaera mikurensis]|uniref:Putative transposase for insertion sequence element n=1 Tax=Phycisphaera mikurensis (strain NBRC 102666 / KCTC 22515 / FYK2301M01) TaxID=1142394 RepID=I0IDF7_PHYMF|nr:helix-turn-helix domain-containing protein [Phycisphaera mikurensis]BAM03295.1 putative transposase for insertion sequence element [Phycisphaera mikurensis NBRC 102666]BAM05185.1 putative transposase for insertion sequence element [Phycisphaera mikurensis NBRC 102666]